MFELITKALKEGNIKPLVNFPDNLMTDTEKDIVEWVLQYNSKYGQLPSPNTLSDEVDNYIPLENNEPLQRIADVTRETKRRQIAQKFVNDIALDLDKGNIPMDDINQLAQIMNFSTGDYVEYTKFDREQYFKNDFRLYFGLSLIDKFTGGLGNGELAYLVGRLGTYKTLLSQFFIDKWMRQEYRILFISNEMPPVDICLRMDGIEFAFNPLSVRNTSQHGAVRSKLQGANNKLSKYKGEIIIPTERMITPSQVFAKARYLECDAILIDGVYLMQPDNSRAFRKWERVSEVSNQLKQGVLENDIPLLGISQIKRTDKDGNYNTEDLAFSDSLAQDGDFVMVIEPDKVDPSEFKVRLIKNRFGPSDLDNIARINFNDMKLIDMSKASKIKHSLPTP